MSHLVELLERRRFFAVYGLDPTFGDSGRIPVAQLASSFTPAISFVHTLPDGKVLAGGRTSFLGGRVYRFNVAGEPDTTFGGGDGSTDVIDMFQVRAGVMQGDGKILLLGPRRQSADRRPWHAPPRRQPPGARAGPQRRADHHQRIGQQHDHRRPVRR